MKILAHLICAALLAVAAPAGAQVTRDLAAAIAQRETGGRVLAVDRADFEGRVVWRIKVVTPAGEVLVILLDMGTGRPL